jgi:hypothetical protein
MICASDANHREEGVDDLYFYRWTLYQCPACKRPTLLEEYSSTEDCNVLDDQPIPVRTTVLYPAAGRLLPYLPENVASEYNSAIKIRAHDPNAFAVCARRGLEAACADHEAKGKTLAKQLLNLASRGLFPATIAEASDSVRLVGNIGAHSSRGHVSQYEASVLLSLLTSVLEYLYVAPALVRELSDAISDSTKKH